ncbi:MAG: hypothetical protein HC887_05810 [Desulfobacteraceae bacterium]|nr:hypothetical protein [Desulfobacteraceae bacterium]
MKRIVWMSFVLICFMIGHAYALDISRIEINQALGVQKDNHLNFVAGKDTVVRAFLSEAIVVNAAQTWAKVNKDGTQVVQLEPSRPMRRSMSWISSVRLVMPAATGLPELILSK